MTIPLSRLIREACDLDEHVDTISEQFALKRVPRPFATADKMCRELLQIYIRELFKPYTQHMDYIIHHLESGDAEGKPIRRPKDYMAECIRMAPQKPKPKKKKPVRRRT